METLDRLRREVWNAYGERDADALRAANGRRRTDAAPSSCTAEPDHVRRQATDRGRPRVGGRGRLSDFRSPAFDRPLRG